MKIKKNSNSYEQLYKNLIDRILKGKGDSSREQRQVAFNNADVPQRLSTLINKVACNAYKVSDSDINAVKRAGVSEDQLFELIICGAVGQASRQYENGLAALAEAIKEGDRHAS